MDDILKGHFLLLLVLAGRHANTIPYDPEYIRQEIHATRPVDFEKLISKGFIKIESKETINERNKELTEIEREGEIENTLVDKKCQEELDNILKNIIDDLNDKTGKKYRVNNKETRKLVSGRLKDNYSIEDFYHINTVKSDEWLNTEWEQYLRPSTLYQKSKFDSYCNQKILPKRDGFTF
tara:strand:- start:299 stop:838 length:540 start_codon:yes stop_codon:yes gene_type:complete